MRADPAAARASTSPFIEVFSNDPRLADLWTISVPTTRPSPPERNDTGAARPRRARMRPWPASRARSARSPSRRRSPSTPRPRRCEPPGSPSSGSAPASPTSPRRRTSSTRRSRRAATRATTTTRRRPGCPSCAPPSRPRPPATRASTARPARSSSRTAPSRPSTRRSRPCSTRATRCSSPPRTGRRTRRRSRSPTGSPVVLPTTEATEFRVTVDAARGGLDPADEGAAVRVAEQPDRGCLPGRGEVEAIGRWAVEHRVWVITDEIYEHLTFGDASLHVDAGHRPRARRHLRRPERGRRRPTR